MRRLAALALVLLFATVASAEHLRPRSGGTRTEPDPEKKKLVRIVGETETVRVTVGAGPREGAFRPKDPIATVWVKIENLSDQPLTVDPAQWVLVDDQGRAYAGLTIDDATERLIRAKQGIISFGSALGSDRGDKGEAHNTIENMIRRNLEKPALRPGAIPPKSFKDGVVYIESPQIKKGTVKLTLTGLWQDPVIFEVTN